MDAAGLAANSVVSVMVGVALWAALPRGVVLTRSLRPRDQLGEQQFQTWEVKNDSPLPIRLTRVSYSGVNTVDLEANVVREVDLTWYVPHEEQGALGISLRFDDEQLEMTRDADEIPWNRAIVPPGDTLTAFVNLNRTLKIRYRRAGIWGAFERRTLTIDGGV